MTFDEWYEALPSMALPEKFFAFLVWKAAADVERKACANVCKKVAREFEQRPSHYDWAFGADECFERIQERRRNSQLPTT